MQVGFVVLEVRRQHVNDQNLVEVLPTAGDRVLVPVEGVVEIVPVVVSILVKTPVLGVVAPIVVLLIVLLVIFNPV